MYALFVTGRSWKYRIQNDSASYESKDNLLFVLYHHRYQLVSVRVNRSHTNTYVLKWFVCNFFVKRRQKESFKKPPKAVARLTFEVITLSGTANTLTRQLQSFQLLLKISFVKRCRSRHVLSKTNSMNPLMNNLTAMLITCYFKK